MGSYLDKLLLGIKQVWRDGVPLPQRPVINLHGFSAVLDDPALGCTDIYVSTGGSGGGSLLVIQNNGSAMPVEPALNFVGFTVADNPGSTRTDVTPIVPAGTGLLRATGGVESLLADGTQDQLLGMSHGGSPVKTWFTLGGDGLLSAGSLAVTGLLTHALPGLSVGYLVWTGAAWAFSIAGLFTPGGDLAGSATVQEVVGLLSHALPSLTVGALSWTGSAWALVPFGVSDPGAVLTANTAVGATQTWVVINSSGGGFTLTYAVCLPGVIYRISDRGGALSGGNQVVVSVGAATYSIEDPSPPFGLNSRGTSPPSVPLVTPYATYELTLDPTANVLRCIT
jgi:hypothetical protein